MSEARTQELWAVLQRPQLPVPDHVVRAKARLMLTLVEELTPVVAAVDQYREAIDAFFAGLPEGQWIRTLPIGKHGVTAPTLWALLGDTARAVGIVSTPPRARRRCARDNPERPAAGRSVPIRL